jgi:hypothetical protein
MEQSNYSSVIQDSSVAFTFTAAPNDHRETNFYLARSGAIVWELGDQKMYFV